MERKLSKEDYQAKKDARIARYEKYSENAQARSNEAYERQQAIGSHIPMGQPILVGHHSERGARRDQARMHNLMDRSVEEQKKAEHWESRAASASKSKAVMSDDPEAIEKLKDKLDKRTKLQDKYKVLNAAVRLKNAVEGDRRLTKIGLSEDQIKELREPDFCGRVGIPRYMLTNNNANINTLRKRIAALEAMDARQPFDFSIGEIEVKEEEGQVRVYFPCRPDEATRKKLKTSPLALKWSRFSEAWVRKITPTFVSWYERELKLVLSEAKAE